MVELAELGDPGQERVVVLEPMLVQLLDGHGLERSKAEARRAMHDHDRHPFYFQKDMHAWMDGHV